MARPIPDLNKVSKLSEPATIDGRSKTILAQEEDIPYFEGVCRKKSNNSLVLGKFYHSSNKRGCHRFVVCMAFCDEVACSNGDHEYKSVAWDALRTH